MPVSEFQCKCIMMGTIHLHAWTRTQCAINFDSFVRRCSLNLLLKYSSETTRLSAGRPSGAKHCSSRTQSRSLAAEYKNSCAFALYMAKTHEGSHLRGRQNVVICCVEFERDPVHSASLEKKKEMEFVRQVSLLSDINQLLKQEFGRIAMKRSRHVHVIQTCFGRPLIGFRCFADKP
jgi:hypothetical protein